MKNTGIKVTELTNEEMLNHKEKEYNQSEWKKAVERMIEYNAKFYEAKPDEHFSYTRFFTTYKLDKEGLFLLNRFSAYSGSITDAGFTRAFVRDGEIFTNGFGDNGNKRIINTKEGRKWLAENICKYGTMVTNCL